MHLQSLCLLVILVLNLPNAFAIVQRQTPKKTSFTRYIEYAETPFHRPSYFSVPYRIPPNRELHYISNNMFRHLIQEHTRHQQRVRLIHQNRRPHHHPHFNPLQSTQEPILKGVKHLEEMRQTPFQRFTHNSSTSMTYEEKRRLWKEDLKKRMRGNKQPARLVGDTTTPVGTAGRYYITFNPFSNAYQVSRRLPSYVQKEDLEPEMQPDALLSTVVQATTTPRPTTTQRPTTPAPIVQHATEIEDNVEQLIRIPSIPKRKPMDGSSTIRQILNLDYYDDDLEPESEESEPETTQRPLTTTTTTTTTQRPFTTTQHPTQPQIVYPPITQTPQPIPTLPTTTAKSVPISTQRSSLFSSYEDDEGAFNDDEDDEDFTWFKPDTRRPAVTSKPTSDDPFSITVHSE